VLLRPGELVAERTEVPRPDPTSPQALAACVADLVSGFSWSGPVGCSFPAVVKEGVALTSEKLDGDFIGVDVAGLLSEACGLRVAVVKDADAVGIAEMVHGAGEGRRGVTAVVNLGTGIGSALFVDDNLVPNTQLGELETDDLRAHLAELSAGRAPGDMDWAAWAQAVEAYLKGLDTQFWPDLMIVSGRMGSHAAEFLPKLSTRCPVVPAKLTRDAAIVGAAMVGARP
jgi:polyphosphate glucokinase